MSLRHIAAVCVGLALLLCFSARAGAFEVPEKLQYDIWWTAIKAGHSSIEIAPDGDDYLKIISRTRSANWLSKFYKVDDRITVKLLNDETLHPIDYHIKLKEGHHRKERRVTFDPETGKIILNNVKKNKIKEFTVEGEIHDPLSAFYRIRRVPAEVGKSYFIKVFDNGKIYDVEVKVLKKQRIKVPAGTFDTIKIKPILRSEGIFMRKGSVYIWVTDDERRIPVKIKSRVAIGSVNALLTGGNY